MAEAALEGRVLGGRYRLKRLLAVGGMGAVWAAEDAVLGREVAVKVLGEALAGDRRAALRLRREARAAGRLAHPGIARVLDLREDDAGRPYLVMELLHGESLAARLARAGPLAPAEAVRVVATAADALEVAHRAGIVHRDVKPGNVFVTSGGDVKLLDFGIASAANEAALTGGDLLGTAAYLAPERMLGHDATPAADVYALGVLLYELLAGRPPFAGDTGTALAMAHVHARPAPLGTVAPDKVPPALAAACERALAKDPAARPPSAAALAALLRSTVAPAPAHPQPAAAGAPIPAYLPAPALGAPTPAHPQPAAMGAPTPAHPRAAVAGAPTARGAATMRRRREAWMVAAAVLLAVLLVAVPGLGLVPLGGREPAGPVGQAPAGGQAPTGGQAPAGGGLGAAEVGQGQTPAGGADQPGRDLGDGNGRDGGDDGEGSGGGGSGGEGGGGGSSGPD
jgi:eukaryotic-like serine/threonine-protein kinase